MTEHLPECPKHADRYAMAGCMCPSLRACEQRVATERNLAWQKECDKAWDDGMAVAAQGIVTANLERLDAALAAIDALREGEK